MNMNSLVIDGADMMCFSTNFPCEFTRSNYKKKNLPKFMRIYNENIKLQLKCHKIKSKLLSKVNNAFHKNGM